MRDAKLRTSYSSISSLSSSVRMECSSTRPRCEGRKPLSETRPEVVALARRLRRRRPKGGQLSLRGVSKELAARGFLNELGKPYAAKSVASMLHQTAHRWGPVQTPGG
jgi:hypothetical protein